MTIDPKISLSTEETTNILVPTQAFDPDTLAAMIIARINKEKGTGVDGSTIITEFIFYAIDLGLSQILLNFHHLSLKDKSMELCFKKIKKEWIKAIDTSWSHVKKFPYSYPKSFITLDMGNLYH